MVTYLTKEELLPINYKFIFVFNKLRNQRERSFIGYKKNYFALYF